MIEKKSENNGVKSVAKYSDCEKYRYSLTRVWDKNKDRILFIGLNPSTATEVKNDPTVARMINFAKQWGFGSISVCNIFAFRSTFPKIMKREKNPVGNQNDAFIKKELKKAKCVVAAWGNHGKFLDRSSEVRTYLNNFSHFGFTKQNEPRHVLYLRDDAKLKSENSPARI